MEKERSCFDHPLSGFYFCFLQLRRTSDIHSYLHTALLIIISNAGYFYGLFDIVTGFFFVELVKALLLQPHVYEFTFIAVTMATNIVQLIMRPSSATESSLDWMKRKSHYIVDDDYEYANGMPILHMSDSMNNGLYAFMGLISIRSKHSAHT